MYPESIAGDVSQERLKEFFVRNGATYQVVKRIRDMVVFAVQSIIKDPPFSRLNLISCRNLLIYLGSDLQKQVIPTFQYALMDHGYLFLGSSETLGEFAEVFETIDKKWKIYKSLGRLPQMRFRLGGPSPPFLENNQRAGFETTIKSRVPRVRDITESVLLEGHTPTALLVNERAEILYVHGNTGKFLEAGTGEPTWNVLRMARMHLTNALRGILTQKKKLMAQLVDYPYNGDTLRIKLTVKAVPKQTSNINGMGMILFDELSAVKTEKLREKSHELPEDKCDVRIREVEQELKSTKEYLQTTTEELEASNEELQSVNEELVTVNSELQSKIDELTHSNNDLNNLLSSTEIGTLFLDRKLCVQRFTSSVVKMVHLIDTDIGRPLGHIVSNLKYVHLVEDAKHVLDTLEAKEKEVQSKQVTGSGCA